MRQILAIAAAALVGLWANGAGAASESAPSQDGTSLTFAPADSAMTTPAGVLDPAFRSGTFAAVLAEPPASTIAFRFGNDAIQGSGLLERDYNFGAGATSPFTDQSGLSLRDVIVSAALTPNTDITFAQGRDLAAMGVLGGGVSSYDSLFLTTAGMRSPYLSLTDGGIYAGMTLRLDDALQLRFGHAALGSDAAARQNLLASAGLNALPRDLALQLVGERSAGTTAASLDWNFADWGTLGATASRTNETGELLGATPLAIATASETAALGVSARVGFGAGWVTTISYSEGVTQLDLSPTGIVASPETFKTRSYGITFAKEGLFGDDTLGLSLSRPLQAYDSDTSLLGRIALDGGAGFGESRGLLGRAQESDIEFGYVTSFLGGSIALQANAAYQVNANGQRGQNAVSVVSRAKINF